MEKAVRKGEGRGRAIHVLVRVEGKTRGASCRAKSEPMGREQTRRRAPRPASCPSNARMAIAVRIRSKRGIGIPVLHVQRRTWTTDAWHAAVERATRTDEKHGRRTVVHLVKSCTGPCRHAAKGLRNALHEIPARGNLLPHVGASAALGILRRRTTPKLGGTIGRRRAPTGPFRRWTCRQLRVLESKLGMARTVFVLAVPCAVSRCHGEARGSSHAQFQDQPRQKDWWCWTKHKGWRRWKKFG
mmetsp:Transcript_172/g.1288  ORF Transcript_172/g.1288 Transcript_172/m.1288 type:complete len:243 (+) Transcript_172:323-1051(+)